MTLTRYLQFLATMALTGLVAGAAAGYVAKLGAL